MSLDWNIGRIEQYDTQEKRDAMTDEQWSVTNAIIWGCLGTEIGTITEANYHEWFIRYETIARLEGFDAIPLADVKAHIGLGTNVFPTPTRSQWLKRHVGGRMDDRVLSAKHYEEAEASVPDRA